MKQTNEIGRVEDSVGTLLKEKDYLKVALVGKETVKCKMFKRLREVEKSKRSQIKDSEKNENKK